jgi:hypothetical protein
MAMYFPFAQGTRCHPINANVFLTIPVFFATLLASLNMRRRARDIATCACSQHVEKAPLDTERGVSNGGGPPVFHASLSGSIMVLSQDRERVCDVCFV